jgi:UDP-N-acetylmuramate dehydrogenase
MNHRYQKFIEKFGHLRVKLGEPMSNHTYFKIGGPVDLFFEPTTTEEFIESLTYCKKNNLPFCVIGGGANVLFSDKGFRGIVIHNKVEEIKLVGFLGKINEKKTKVDKVFVQASSGTPISRLARYTIEQGLQGLEFLVSVPGTIGGALKINAHFRPQNNEFIGNCLHEATLFNKEGEIIKTGQKYFRFAYDNSIIQESGDIVIEAVFVLKKGDKNDLWGKAQESIDFRKKTQPLGSFSSGCIFKNISIADAKMLSTPNETTSAGYIIDKTGLCGYRIGDVEISKVHGNYFLNLGEAKASDVLKLMTLVKQEVREKFNLELKEEVFLIGDF